MSWSAEQYSKFENERNRPVIDLLAHIPTENVYSAADIGCGPGNSTELLLAKYPHALVMGMDSSEDMIAAARRRLPDIRFDVADISTWNEEGPFDIILANAALQWVPDHSNLFPALINKLSSGGSLAVQMPDNFEEPSHRLMREVASSAPWKEKLSTSSQGVRREPAEWYYQELRKQVSMLEIWRTTYYHLLAGGADAIVEWFKGTGLQPFLNPLNETERMEFIRLYKTAVSQAYTIYAEGSVLLPFPRLFIVATR